MYKFVVFSDIVFDHTNLWVTFLFCYNECDYGREGGITMEHLLFIETGVGVDVHGQDVTTAAVRAVIDAIHKNSMPGITEFLPDHDLNNMKVNIRLAVPLDKDFLDTGKVKAEIPYGTVTVDVVDGGMAAPSGIVLKEKNDKNDLMYIVNASVEVGY